MRCCVNCKSTEIRTPHKVSLFVKISYCVRKIFHFSAFSPNAENKSLKYLFIIALPQIFLYKYSVLQLS